MCHRIFLITLTIEQLCDIIEKKTTAILAKKMKALNEKTTILQQTIDNCCTATLNQMKIIDNMMLEEKELVFGLEEQVEVNLPEKISAMEDQMLTKLESLKQNIERSNNKGTKVCDALQSRLKTQSTTIDVIEQQLKCRNVVVVGLQDKDDEDSTKEQIVTLARDIMGMSDIKTTDIETAYRIGRKKEDNQPRHLLLKFKSKQKRNDFYKRRKRTPIASDVMKNIYINEDLTQHRARIFHDARKLVKKGKLRYTWTQNGNIMIRVTEDSPPTAVHSNEELQSMLQASDNDSTDPSMDYGTPREQSETSSDED